VEEYASQAEWIERLLRPLNVFSQTTVNAVNGGLTIAGNIVASYRTVRAVVPALPWVALTPQNSTQTAGEPTLAYYVDALGEVYLRGAVAPTTKADNTIMFTMPATLYPETTQTLLLNHDHGSSHAYCKLSSVDGTMRIFNLSSSATNVFFNNITYFAVTPPAITAYVGPDWPIRLSTGFGNTVAAVLLTQAIDTETKETTSAGTANIDWEISARNEVSIKRVNGLTPKRTYDLTFLILGA
jgi:hypothetical protein